MPYKDYRGCAMSGIAREARRSDLSLCVVYVLVRHVDTGADEERLSHKIENQGDKKHYSQECHVTPRRGRPCVAPMNATCGRRRQAPPLRDRKSNLWDNLRTSAAHKYGGIAACAGMTGGAE